MKVLLPVTEARRWLEIEKPSDLDRTDLNALWGFQSFARNHLFMAQHDDYYQSRLAATRIALLVENDRPIGYAVMPPRDPTTHSGFRAINNTFKAPTILGLYNTDPASTRVTHGPSDKGPPTAAFPVERDALIRHWGLDPRHTYTPDTYKALVDEKSKALMKEVALTPAFTMG